jgi:ATP-dependent 26S proteasome regulatory subunit
MRDLPVWLAGPPGAVVLRALRNLARFLPAMPRDRAQAIIVLTPSAEVPPELAGHATVVEWPLPDREEIAAIYDAQLEALPDEMRATASPNGTRDAAIDAAVGLNGTEVGACYAKSLVQQRRIDVPVIVAEKKRVIARERVLEWFDPLPGGLDAVGGLDALKEWLKSRAMAYSPKAREYGLPAPKGALVGGVPGTGKSLTAKAVAAAWGVPLLRLDLGAVKSKFVGESEANLRRAFRTIEAIGRCVVWIDEIEKALQGATSGAADGGVSSDALGALLSWMQERKSEAFVIATANDVEALPAELLRKGRFDENWWVDLPTAVERSAIIKVSLKQYKRSADGWQAGEFLKLVDATDGFTGSEIAALVPDAMFAAFADGGRELAVGDLMRAAGTVVPLAKTAAKRIEALREWAKGKMRPATSTMNVVELRGRSGAAPALDL